MASRDKLQPHLRRTLAETCARLVAVEAERIVRFEHIGERVHEEELDEHERVRVRRTIDRTIVRNELRERYSAAMADVEAGAALVVPRVRAQIEADLSRIVASVTANPRDAIKNFNELLPAGDWPVVLVMADPPSESERLVQYLLSLGLRCPPDEALNRFGIVWTACPPDVQIASAVAESPLIEAMADPSAPVLAPAPQALETQMVEARGLLNITPGMMTGYGHDVTVAVLDTGIDMAHPSFARMQPGDYYNFTRFEDADDQGHGTHVASIAAGEDRIGPYSGIAPRAHLVAGKVIPGRCSGHLEDVLRGMAWAVFDKRADVLSLSIADGETPANGRSIWSRACDEAHRNGTVVCVAVGNLDPAYPETVMVPADAVHAVTVGAIDKERHLASFSAQGSENPNTPLYGKPNCVAPGVGIVGARSSNSENEPFRGNLLYTQLSGTSMAAPIASGCMALVKSKARSLGWEMTPAELVDVFYSACCPLSTPDGGGYSSAFEIGRGLPDMQQAFLRVEALAPSRATGVAVAHGSPADPVVGVAVTTSVPFVADVCYACGRKYMSKVDTFSPVWTCVTCAAPICSVCWRKGKRACEKHEPAGGSNVSVEPIMHAVPIAPTRPIPERHRTMTVDSKRVASPDLWGPIFLNRFDQNVRESKEIVHPTTGDVFRGRGLRPQEFVREFGHVRQYELKSWTSRKPTLVLTAVNLNDESFESGDRGPIPSANILQRVADRHRGLDMDDATFYAVGLHSRHGWPPEWEVHVATTGNAAFYFVSKLDAGTRWKVLGAGGGLKELFNPESLSEQSQRVLKALTTDASLLAGLPLELDELQRRIEVTLEAIEAAAKQSEGRYAIRQVAGQLVIQRSSR